MVVIGMNEFKESGSSGIYFSGLPYTPFHKEGQLWDFPIGQNVVKTSFWRILTYYSIFAALFFAIILLLNVLFSYSPLNIVEVSEKGKVLFWGKLEKSPIVIKSSALSKLDLGPGVENKSLDKWQKFLDGYIKSNN